MIVLFAIFAVYRVAHLLATEEGPFEICTRWRNLWIKDDWIGRGMRCPLCIGFWLAWVAAVMIAPDWHSLFWYWLGIAGAQLFLYRLGD